MNFFSLAPPILFFGHHQIPLNVDTDPSYTPAFRLKQGIRFPSRTLRHLQPTFPLPIPHFHPRSLRLNSSLTPGLHTLHISSPSFFSFSSLQRQSGAHLAPPGHHAKRKRAVPRRVLHQQRSRQVIYFRGGGKGNADGDCSRLDVHLKNRALVFPHTYVLCVN